MHVESSFPIAGHKNSLLSEQDATAAFYETVAASFARARAETHVQETGAAFFEIGGVRVRVDIAGSALSTLTTRALQHSQIPAPARADAAIGLWEIRATDVPLPPPPWAHERYLARGEIMDFDREGYFTTYHPDGRVLYTFHAYTAQGYAAVFDREKLPAYEIAAPMRPLLYRLLETRGVQYLHAAAVGLEGGGVLLAGKSGAGKSTTALACLASPLKFAGDDYCAVRVDDTPTVYSIYSSAKGHFDTVRRLPFLEPLISNRETQHRDKAIWFLHEHMPEKIIRHFPLRAILIPRITDQAGTRVSPAPPRAALLALAPSTVAQLPAAGGEVFQRLAALVRRLPCFYLDLGADMQAIPQVIIDLLDAQGVRP